MISASTCRINCPKRSAPRKLRVERLEARYVLDGVSLAPDAFELQQNRPQIELDVLANDTFDSSYEGDRLITSTSYGSEGGRIEIAADRQSILYTPPADFFGTETFVYAVDGEFTAQVQIAIRAPLAFDQFEIPPDGVTRTLDVLANDPFWTGYVGERRITAVSVGSEGGTVEIGADGRSITYTPPDEVFGSETFVYIVDEIYPAQVTIKIPKTLEGDTFEFVQHAPQQTLDVLANDPFWSGYSGERRITHIVGAEEGTAEISADGRSIVYTPGASGWKSFRYVVDATYEANVSVVLHRPVRDDWFEVDRNSSGFFYNVTSNDTYEDLNRVRRDVIDRVTSVTQSQQGGTVTISADGQGILYTPPEGFYGPDTFTYVADGVHEATVHVNVTRPVRDDSLSVYQDTPDGMLHVLANDFIGNGYGGARLITAVSATENGGVLTIRGDGKAILYTPAPGFTGSDRFTYTVDGDLEATVSVYVRPLADGDHFRFAPDPTHGPYVLHVLANDHFGKGYQGPGLITGASVTSGSGSVSIQSGQRLLFTPSHSGWHALHYTVDGQYEASVSVWIADHLNPDEFVFNQNAPSQQLFVLANDFVPSNYAEFPSQDYVGPRRITAASESRHGGTVTVAADGLSVHYQPSEDFVGEDQFTYTVDGIMVETVTVQVIRRVRDDSYRVDSADGQESLPVLVNDLLGADYSGPGRITGVTAISAGGTATIAADGRSILYTPPAEFVGTETFTYTVDGALKAEVSVVVDASREDQLPTFGSLEEFTQFLLDDALTRYEHLFGMSAWGYLYGPEFVDTTIGGPAPPGERSHSETNVQVAGVDEGDIVEFDSDYLYMLTDGDVVIVNAWPAEELSIASRVDIEGRTIAAFLHGDRLTVISEIGGGYDWPIWYGGGPFDFVADRAWWPQPMLPFSTIVTVIDVSDRTEPTIVQTTTMEGRYVDSRGVGDYVYVLVNNPDAVAAAPLIIDDDENPETPGRYETREEFIARVTANPGQFVEEALPNYSSYDGEGELVRTGLLNMPEDIFQPLVPDATSLISVVSFNIESDEPGLADTSAVYSTGASTIYASLDNFYVFDGDYSAEDGAITRIVKFDWAPETGGIDFAATTTVPGSILNQFSADENGPYLRVATTVSNYRSGNWSGRDENMLFVLQEDDGVFEVVGGLQNLALNERMQSVRFLGDRAFVTTFRTIDPLFAIDLSDPAHPESVGHITLPGFTSYMHLVGENHLLTVGRNTPMGFAGPTQVSLFDISDLTQPRRIAEYTFERFSTSEAEVDHHAFGYYAEHGLLGMPVSRTYFERVDTDGDGYRETRQVLREDKLAVFSVDAAASEPSGRLALVSEIEHGTAVRRSGYIGDKLYSVAGDSVKVVDVAAPTVILAELEIEPREEVEPPVVIVDVTNPFYPGSIQLQPVVPVFDFPAARDDAAFEGLVNRARADLAVRLGIDSGAPMLVTAESAPGAPGGGYYLVFRVGDELHLYRATGSVHVEFVQSHFEFANRGDSAWNAVDTSAPAPTVGIVGDYNLDGRVDNRDRDVWKTGFGDVSLSALHPADGNRDGVVDSADYTLWQNNFGAIAGDFNGDGVVDEADHGQGANFDAAAYTLWRDHLGAGTAVAAAVVSGESGAEGAVMIPALQENAIVRGLAREEATSPKVTSAHAEAFANMLVADSVQRQVAIKRSSSHTPHASATSYRAASAESISLLEATDAVFTEMTDREFDPLRRFRDFARFTELGSADDGLETSPIEKGRTFNASVRR